MTAQIPDEFRYNGDIYSLVGIDGEGLFTPLDFGMNPYSTCTACWRGYVMKYDCVDNQLLLVGMDVNSNESPDINGVPPIKGANYFAYGYVDLGLKTHFSGSLLLARDFIQEMYVHMGFQRPMAYKEVLEITIKSGDIVEVRDLSEEMEQRRKMDSSKGAQPKSRSEPDVKQWIEDTFSLDYKSNNEE